MITAHDRCASRTDRNGPQVDPQTDRLASCKAQRQQKQQQQQSAHVYNPAGVDRQTQADGQHYTQTLTKGDKSNTAPRGLQRQQMRPRRDMCNNICIAAYHSQRAEGVGNGVDSPNTHQRVKRSAGKFVGCRR